MDRNRLHEMAANPDNIPGIYNYCDRWCERCTFTSRCLQFQMEQEEQISDDPEDTDLENSDFWKKIEDSFSIALEMIQDLAEEEGIDLNDIDIDKEIEGQKKRDEIAHNHPCSKAALEYSELMNNWFDSATDLIQSGESDLQFIEKISFSGRFPKKTVNEIKDNIEVLRWYQHFLYPKIMRAITGKMEEVPEILEDMPKDFEGSAKIALIAIDRTMAAWAGLMQHFPGMEDETLKILVFLGKLRRSLEHTIPGARSFIRPGFDE